MQIIVLLGQSGMGKSTFLNAMAGQELAQTGNYFGTTTATRHYEFERDGKKNLIVDTVGTYDNRDIDLTDEKILAEL